MRKSTSFFHLASAFALVLGAACGDDTDHGSVDAPGSNGGNGDAAIDSGGSPASVIPGGGIGGGPIHGVVNVYAIDDATRQPIAGATVTVGSASGTTDATGLFVANGVTGPQTVVVSASGYRTEMWVGAAGANMTTDLQKSVVTAQSAKLSATIDMSSFPVAPGHVRFAAATYSQQDGAPDIENNLDQGSANSCGVGATGSASCTLVVTSRPGTVDLVAAVLDVALAGSATTETLAGWADLRDVAVTAGSDQTGLTLTAIGSASTTTERANFGTPPADLTQQLGIIGIEDGSAGVLELPLPVSPGSPTLLVPSLDQFGAGATYRLTAIASGSGADATTSAVVVHSQTGATLTAGTWLTPPTSATVTRAMASWSAVPGATVQGIQFASGATQILNVTVFDGSTTVTFPAAAGIPASGALSANLTALAAPGLDVTNFSLDTDRNKLSAEVSEPTQVAN